MYIPLTFEGALQKCLYASGGFSDSFISGSDQYWYHYFTGSGNYSFEVKNGTLDAQILVVGGGGGGARGTTRAGGGGGGGVNYVPSQKLYQGIYNIAVGYGGAGGVSADNNGLNGSGSYFTGGPNNVFITAAPGLGGTYVNDGTSGGGASGAPTYHLGAANAGTSGGGGGGALSAATNNTGAPGLNIYIASSSLCYGAGGGGSAQFNYGGGGCQTAGDGNKSGYYNTDGADNFGGGGGASYSGQGTQGGKGGSGIVVIQYKVNDYCKNFFNKTGSCGCIEHTFDVTDGLNFAPTNTGSYMYTQCGTNTLVSGSVNAYFPTTVCVASGSFIWANGLNNYSGFATGSKQCFSASFGIQTCVTQSFTPICSSSIVTFYAGTGSASPQTYYYVPKNGSNFVYNTLQNQYVTYACVSSASIGSIGYYPYGISGVGSQIIPGASCNTVTFTSTATGAYRYYRYQTCGGAPVADRFFGAGTITACVDTNFFYGFYNGTTNTTVTVAGTCLSGSIDTGSCGCP